MDRFDGGTKPRIADDGAIEQLDYLLTVARHALARVVQCSLAASVGLPTQCAFADEQFDQCDRSLARGLMQWGRLIFAGLAR